MCTPTIFLWQIEVTGTITKTLSCWVRALLRNIISHLHLLFILSPAPNSAIGGMDHGSTAVWVDLWWGCTGNRGDDHHGCLLLFLSWFYIWRSRAQHSASPCCHTWSTTQATIRSLGFFAKTIVGHQDGAYVPWATSDPDHRANAVASPPYLEYPLGVTPTFEEDPSEEQSSTASCSPHEAESNRRVCHIEVLSRHPCIIHMPFVPLGWGARRSRHSRLWLP